MGVVAVQKARDLVLTDTSAPLSLMQLFVHRVITVLEWVIGHLWNATREPITREKGRLIAHYVQQVTSVLAGVCYYLNYALEAMYVWHWDCPFPWSCALKVTIVEKEHLPLIHPHRLRNDPTHVPVVSFAWEVSVIAQPWTGCPRSPMDSLMLSRVRKVHSVKLVLICLQVLVSVSRVITAPQIWTSRQRLPKEISQMREDLWLLLYASLGLMHPSSPRLTVSSAHQATHAVRTEHTNPK